MIANIELYSTPIIAEYDLNAWGEIQVYSIRVNPKTDCADLFTIDVLSEISDGIYPNIYISDEYVFTENNLVELIDLIDESLIEKAEYLIMEYESDKHDAMTDDYADYLRDQH